jgi:hypothetical protein
MVIKVAGGISWLEVGITGHILGRGPSKDHSTKVWLQLAQWYLRRRLKCEMLTDGRRMKSDDNSSHGLKARCTNLWPNIWFISQAFLFYCISKHLLKIFGYSATFLAHLAFRPFKISSPPFFYFELGDHLGWKSGSPDTFLEGGHPRTIPPKFGCNWPSGIW